MKDYPPDRRTVVHLGDGVVNVDLRRGLLRARVLVWKDVRPALGGLLGRRSCWVWRADEVYDDVLRDVYDVIGTASR